MAHAIHRLANPARFLRFARAALPWTSALAAGAFAVGLWLALVDSPIDYQQRDTVRIMHVHVPAAWLAMMAYAVLAGASATALVWKHPLADIAGKACAPVGAVFTGIALVTGAIWGQPTWGTWWEWDARLTSMLILFFLYVGVMALRAAIEHPDTAARATAVLSLVGIVNLPIIRYSVNWWNTLHQPSSIKLTESSLAPEMLYPLLACLFGFYCLFAVLVMLAARNEVLLREYRSHWVKQIVG